MLLCLMCNAIIGLLFPTSFILNSKYLLINFCFQDRIGTISSSSSSFQNNSSSRSPPVSLSEFQPPYFPPPLTQLSQEHQQMFNSLPVSPPSLQLNSSLPSLVTLPPASADSFPVTSSLQTSLQSFTSQQTRRLTHDSSSPLSLVRR